ncbi:ABC transporter substrate-binding protein [Celeribacter indicus]|uniref:Periplasmic binding protein n=1 Tax=Celeribacter indicus TaxID=1208324 RepID=A0A0B5E090_9RHOB|nr:ABC transporter substrate-binding protein [Celeribacter indicus]AJE46820.1 periplasmic binding protein [Celeribacter indicus]SDW81129.1 iron complex transport system substrate-binding protein [Celeribacter indicus]
MFRLPRPMRFALMLAAALTGAQEALAEIAVTDITGREVTLEAPAERIVLGDGRHLVVLGMLEDDPVHRIVGWREAKALDPARLTAYTDAFPEIARIASVGAGNRQLSVESTIALAPDLVILSLIDAEDPQMQVPLAQLEAAGIPYVFVDFFTNPIANTTDSLTILGRLIGAEDRAAEFNAYYTEKRELIRARLADADPARPRVFVQVHASGARCCATVGAGVFDDVIREAGGDNLGREIVPGLMGTVGLENLVALDPDYFLATGGQHMRARGGLVLGAGVDPAEAAASFGTLLDSPGIADLRAVEEGHALAVWHLFNDSPIHIALIEYLAQTFHPELFADLDPEATMAEIQTRFSPVRVEGTWWYRAP